MMAVVFVPVMALIALATIHVSVPQGLVWLFAASLLTAPWRQQWLFQATGRMASVANAEILRMAVFAFGVWIFVHSPADILAVGTAELCAVVAMTALCIHVQQRHVTPFRLTGSFSGFGALVREGAAVGSTNFVWALAQSAPLFLVASLSGGLETAWFAGAARIVGSLGQFGNLYHFNLYPSVSRAYALADGSLGQMQARSMRVTAWGGVFIALTLTVLAEPLVKLALGSKLLAAAPLLEILCWILPVALWSGHSRGALAAAGEQKKVLASQIIGLVATVAAYVAKELGYSPDQIEWKESPSAQRETLISNDQVEYIVATYSITDSRKEKVDFAGPYLLTGQSLLVRDDNTDITGAESLQNNKKLCSVTGSTPAQRIKDKYPGVQLQQYDTYSACVEALKNGAIDAVTTDEVILAGYAAQNPGTFKIVGKPFSEERYGIGLKKDDAELRAKINDALEKMESDGAWKAAFEKNLGPAGIATPAAPAVDRY